MSNLEKKKYRLLLVCPKAFTVGYGSLAYVSHLRGGQGGWMNVALATVAAMTPDEHFEIRIIDENVERLDFTERWDIVGLTGFATESARAEILANKFRKNGSLIVCGGPSASLSPELWGSFADVLIRGEAERIWPQFVEDFLAGNHKSRYDENERFSIVDSPKPDYSYMKPESIRQYHGGVVQTSRGCPFNCEFCDVIVYVGRKMRHKEEERVISEIQTLYDLGFRVIFLADDNFGAARAKAKSMLRAIAAWNHSVDEPVIFATQTSIDLAKDDEFLRLAAEASLTRVFVGIETFNKESLASISKMQNVRSNIFEDVAKFHQHGILILAGCVVGFDNDQIDIFERQFRFFQQANIVSPFVFPLQAPDGTPLKKRLVEEGRYIDNATLDRPMGTLGKLFGGRYSVQPKNFSIEALRDGTYWLAWKVNSLENTADRLSGFFDQYDNGPMVGQLNMPKPRPNRESMITAGGIFKHYMRNASAQERKIMRRMLGRAIRSKHPQALAIFFSTFVLCQNSQLVLQREVANIENVECPSLDPERYHQFTSPPSNVIEAQEFQQASA